MRDLPIRFQPKQVELNRLIEHSLSSWIGYGGSRGGAKSGGARRVMLRRRIEYPGTRGQILRRVWEDTRLNHVEKFFEEFPDLREYYSESTHELTVPTNGEPSTILFGHAEVEGDVRRKAYGPEFMDVFVDQAEQFSEKELKLLKLMCRWPNTPLHRCKFGLFFNPGGVGAAFLRRVFYTKEYHERENPDEFTFLQAYGWDNVEWCRDALTTDGLTEKDFYSWTNQQRFEYFITRSQYGRELNSLDSSLRPGHLLGEFSSFAGQYFSNFDPAKHVISEEEIHLEKWWPKWISGDWGFDHPACFHWHARRDDGVILTYRELYGPSVFEKDWGTQIATATPSDETIKHFYFSPDAFAKRGSANTAAQQIGDEVIKARIPRPEHADTDRVGGARLLHQLLHSDSWLISSACATLIETLPILIHDKEPKHEDVLKINATETTVGDDAYDCARYGLKSYLAPGKKPLLMRVEETVAERIAQRPAQGLPLADPFAIAMMTRKAEADEKKKDKLVPLITRGRWGRNRMHPFH
jgi:phage terminase large subunit